MIRADMIPPEVVEAAIDAMSDCGSEVIGSRMARASIAAALNAWPGMEKAWYEGNTPTAIILPLPQEVSDE